MKGIGKSLASVSAVFTKPGLMTLSRTPFNRSSGTIASAIVISADLVLP